MLTHDLNVSVSRPHTGSGVPEAGGPIIDGVIQTEAEDFLLVEAGQFLAFD
jgi:hypothetical protein